MTVMNDTIIAFIREQTCATVCCVGDQGMPWCFSCYYAFDPAEGILYFKSTAGSSHSAILKTNPLVAGTVLPDRLNKLLVKGIQFEGTVLAPEHPLMKKAAAAYHSRHPLALAVTGDTWAIRLNHIKVTDSALGFGKKITWVR